MAKLLYVVHRAYPFPGGSEYYVQDMAEESLRRGHDVTILAHEHRGNQYGIKVTNDYSILSNKFDLIIVHGGDVVSQNIVHVNAAQIKSPILYLIIKPSESLVCTHGLKYDDILGYSTKADIDYLRNHNVLSKSRRVRHGIVPEKTIYPKGKFKARYPSLANSKLYVSAGGFSPHKGMSELAKVFTNCKIPDTILCLFGYSSGEEIQETENVKVFEGFDKHTVMEAISDAEFYVLNSTEEGFGLVLLEAMMNKTGIISREVGAVKDMKEYIGNTYNTPDELEKILKGEKLDLRDKAYNYVMSEHTIKQTIDDIEDILKELK